MRKFNPPNQQGTQAQDLKFLCGEGMSAPFKKPNNGNVGMDVNNGGKVHKAEGRDMRRQRRHTHGNREGQGKG